MAKIGNAGWERAKSYSVSSSPQYHHQLDQRQGVRRVQEHVGKGIQPCSHPLPLLHLYQYSLPHCTEFFLYCVVEFGLSALVCICSLNFRPWYICIIMCSLKRCLENRVSLIERGSCPECSLFVCFATAMNLCYWAYNIYSGSLVAWAKIIFKVGFRPNNVKV